MCVLGISEEWLVILAFSGVLIKEIQFIFFWLRTLKDWLKALKSCGDFLGNSLMKIVQYLYLTWNLLVPRETNAVTISTAADVPFKVCMSWNHKVFVVTSYLP